MPWSISTCSLENADTSTRLVPASQQYHTTNDCRSDLQKDVVKGFQKDLGNLHGIFYGDLQLLLSGSLCPCAGLITGYRAYSASELTFAMILGATQYLSTDAQALEC